MGDAVNLNTLHSPPVCSMFKEIILTIFHVFPRCNDNEVSVIMMTPSSKFCSIS